VAGRLAWRASLRSFLRDVGATLSRRAAPPRAAAAVSFQSRMAAGLKRFEGRVLLVLCGNDLTAQEFVQYTQGSPDWQGLLDAPRVERYELPAADPTFSSAEWGDGIAGRVVGWLHGT